MAKTALARVSEMDPLQRLNLTKFLEDKSFFHQPDDQQKAISIYKNMIGKEKELKSLQKGEISHIQEMPKDFDLKYFTSKTADNVLTRALKQHFDKGMTKRAAWDYITLKRSADELSRKQSKDGKPGEGQGASGEPGQHGAAGAQTQSGPSGGQTQQDGTAEEAMEISDDQTLLEEEMEDFRNSVILSLLWMNHDYFDQKLLAKAQAEYRYYRTLEREWNAQKKGEFKPAPFNLDQFKSLSKNRPIHIVISTILDQARETSHAEAAAEEYAKFRSLENKMNKQIQKECEISLNDKLVEEIKTRYRTPRMSFRQAAEFKMVPLEEYKQLRNTISHQRDQITELSSRLSGIANQQVAEGEIFTDIGNNNTPKRLGQRFAEIFEEAWSNAYEVLKPKKPESEIKPDEKEETDEKTVDILQKIVQVIYEFCKKTADQQTTFLMQGMMPPIINPLSGEQALSSNKEVLEMAGETEKMAKDYRKAVAPATIAALQTAACQEIIKAKLLTGDIGKELKEYIDNCVHLIWYMCIQQPPMILVWGEPGKKFNKEMFRFSGKKGQKFRLTVWPAVLFSEEGGLAAAGYAIPE